MSLHGSSFKKKPAHLQKYDSFCMAMHQQRLRKMKSCLDNKAPKVPSHLRKNAKREQMMEERYAKIERENRLLLEKMSSIKQGGHGIDNRRKRKIKVGSMNKTFRKMELQRITQENQAILRRIQACQPSYNHLRWQQERKQHILNLKNICEYPVQPVFLGKSGRRRRRRVANDYPEDGYYDDMGSAKSLPRLDPEYERQSRERLQHSQSMSEFQSSHQRTGQLRPLQR